MNYNLKDSGNLNHVLKIYEKEEKNHSLRLLNSTLVLLDKKLKGECFWNIPFVKIPLEGTRENFQQQIR